MKRHWWSASTWTVMVVVLMCILGIAVAQETGEGLVQVTTTEEGTEYLVSNEGRALYTLVDPSIVGEADAAQEPVTEGVREAALSCTDGCLDAWPALTSEGTVTTGPGVDGDMLYTASVDGRNQVVYNGWPLYTFARDTAAGDVAGQGVEGAGGTWYVVMPDGTLIQEWGVIQEDGDEEGGDGSEGGNGG